MTTSGPITLASTMTLLIMTATLIFIGVWIAVLVRVILIRRKDSDTAARLPLEDDRVLEPRGKPTDPPPGEPL